MQIRRYESCIKETAKKFLEIKETATNDRLRLIMAKINAIIYSISISTLPNLDENVANNSNLKLDLNS